MLNQEFKKKFDKEQNNFVKIGIKKDFQLFMRKLDSIENIALVGALLKTKNIEDLSSFKSIQPNIQKNQEIAQQIDKNADYPGGINALREEVAKLFYPDGVYAEVKNLKTQVAFIVERDGSISHVKAEGDNFTFNRQAEIALYSVVEKFSPAYINGNSVRSRFRLPLNLKFD